MLSGAVTIVIVCNVVRPQDAAEPEANEPSSSAAPQAATQSVNTGVQCTNKQWKDIFWSDATHTTQVGAMTCTCFGPEMLTGVALWPRPGAQEDPGAHPETPEPGAGSPQPEPSACRQTR